MMLEASPGDISRGAAWLPLLAPSFGASFGASQGASHDHMLRMMFWMSSGTGAAASHTISSAQLATSLLEYFTARCVTIKTLLRAHLLIALPDVAVLDAAAHQAGKSAASSMPAKLSMSALGECRGSSPEAL